MKNTIAFSYRALFVALIIFIAGGCEVEDIGDNNNQNPNQPETPNEAVLPSVTTTEVVEITQIAAKAGGSISADGGATVTDRGVCWGVTSDPTTSNNKVSSGSGTGAFTASITGLEANTTYHVRAYAINNKGTAYGNNFSFTTLEEEQIEPEPPDPQNPEPLAPIVDSRDGNSYQILQIGAYLWMTENLRYLPFLSPPDEGSNGSPCYYVYGFSTLTVEMVKETPEYKTYGVLYNWNAAYNACPDGWRLPTDREWENLIYVSGGANSAGGKLKESGTQHWKESNSGVTNESGFTALPGGYCVPSSLTNFSSLTEYGYWWSATTDGSDAAYFYFLMHNQLKAYAGHGERNRGFSVRCVKDID